MPKTSAKGASGGLYDGAPFTNIDKTNASTAIMSQGEVPGAGGGDKMNKANPYGPGGDGGQRDYGSGSPNSHEDY